jgi:L-Ala-D/L-Glu epimerase
MNLSAHIERWSAIEPFRITGQVWNSFESVVVEISRGRIVGRGEAAGVFYLGETAASILAEIEAFAPATRSGLNRAMLQTLLPPGGARNAIDCALWDLEAKSSGIRVWQQAGITPRPVQSVRTLGLEATADRMAAKAAAAMSFPVLKVKLDGEQPLQCLQAVRAVRRDARIIVDVNQGWNFQQLKAIAPAFCDLGVEMIEQPLPRGADADLQEYHCPVPLCADESCLHLNELEEVASRYDMINIKLDKAGGLTHGLQLAAAARRHKLGVVVGCMSGSSLAMAPAFVLGCIADLVDIDGPLLQKSDRLPGLEYHAGKVSIFGPEVWG